jgi:hypothetical protein
MKHSYKKQKKLDKQSNEFVTKSERSENEGDFSTELNDILEKKLYDFPIINCNTDICMNLTSINSVEISHALANFDVLTRIRLHIYGHVMTNFIPTVCCRIIEDYVGEIPVYKNNEWNYITTLGHIIIDDIKNVRLSTLRYLNNKLCVIVGCDNKSIEHPTINAKPFLCSDHMNQWLKLPRTYFHNHVCYECSEQIICNGHKVDKDYWCIKCIQ